MKHDKTIKEFRDELKDAFPAIRYTSYIDDKKLIYTEDIENFWLAKLEEQRKEFEDMVKKEKKRGWHKPIGTVSIVTTSLRKQVAWQDACDAILFELNNG